MLLHLDLKDFVLVDRTTLDFKAGFSALTGETGAGKSILLDALNFITGGRADTTSIRQGCDKADLSAIFASTADVLTWLEANDFEQEAQVQLRRTLDINGKHRAYINGAPATASQLRELGERLLDIHGQHEQQHLLKTGNQKQLLDDYAQHKPLLENVKQAWLAWQNANSSLQQALVQDQLKQKERDELTWENEALSTLKPVDFEWDSLETEYKRLAYSAQLLSTLQGSIHALEDNDDALVEQIDKLAHSLRQLTKLDSTIADLADPIENASILLQEAARDIRQYLKHTDLDPDRLTQVEERIADIHTCARKLRTSPDTLHLYWKDVQDKLAALEELQDIDSLQQAVQKTQTQYESLALQLSQSRKQAAVKLSSAVTQSMQALALGGGQFQVDCQPSAASQSGIDAIEFLVTANTGQPLRPLAKVASGGELARMSLAICVITSSQSAVPCLIFDEVDSGIGGATADIVGQHLRQLGSQVQVLAVTHLAQVAANAHHQFKVSKHVLNGTTLSTVTPLDDTGRVDEIARMLGGENITVTTRYHAQELLTQALHKHPIS